MPIEFKDILGISSSMGGVFKFGKGVVGKSTIAFVALSVVAGLIVIRPSLIGVAVLLIIVAVWIFWFRCIRNFASEHPDLALLDGAQWTEWKQFEASAKNRPEIVDSSPTSNPQIEKKDR